MAHDETIPLAIVGCGGMARTHADWLKETPGGKVVALCDIDRAAAEKYRREKFNDDTSIPIFENYAQMLRQRPNQLRGIVLVTPHTLHFEQATAALESGYDVLVEKPMVTCSDHARKLAETVKKTGRHFQIAFQAPYSSEFAYLRELLQSGGLGELQTVSAFSCQAWRGDGVARTWRHDPAFAGGGYAYDTGAHLFNAIAWLINRPVEEVFSWIDNKGMAVDINAAITIRWEGNVLGAVSLSGNNPGWQEGIWICGNKGRVFTGIHGGKLEQYDAKGRRVNYPQVTQTYYLPIQNFVACLQGKAEPRCGVRYGILHSWLMDGIYQSAHEGRPVKLSKPPL